MTEGTSETETSNPRAAPGPPSAAASGRPPRDLRVVVLSGPSGSGKTTLVNRLLRESPVPLVKSISATTRPPRRGEIPGEDYYFLSLEEFRQKLDRGEFVESCEVYRSGSWYGTLWSELERARACGAWILLEIDVEGARRVVEKFPDAITIFLRTSSTDDYERRLRARGTDSEEAIGRRVETARRELAESNWYRHQVVNDDLDRAVDEVLHILRAEAAAA